MSGRQRSESHGIGKIKPSRKPKAAATGATPEKAGRKHRATDLGRALRTVYDDTLRESVPDDFLDLLGKLS